MTCHQRRHANDSQTLLDQNCLLQLPQLHSALISDHPLRERGFLSQHLHWGPSDRDLALPHHDDALLRNLEYESFPYLASEKMCTPIQALISQA